MRDAILIQDLSVIELRELIQSVIQQENVELRREVAMLREELRTRRSVLTLKAATYYFDYKVTPATLIDYITYCGLPAFKNGRLWFVYLRDLLDFQVGRIGHESTKHLGIRKVVRPRHEISTQTESISRRRRRDRDGSAYGEYSSESNSTDDKTVT